MWQFSWTIDAAKQIYKPIKVSRTMSSMLAWELEHFGYSATVTIYERLGTATINTKKYAPNQQSTQPAHFGTITHQKIYKMRHNTPLYTVLILRRFCVRVGLWSRKFQTELLFADIFWTKFGPKSAQTCTIWHKQMMNRKNVTQTRHNAHNIYFFCDLLFYYNILFTK